MIEQFLQTALEFFKEIWFQLNSQFGLEDTEAFKFLKPYLLQLQDNPLYMGISIAALFLVPYTLVKVRSISKKRESKLDELMEEMEDDEDDEFDEDDPRRLRRPEQEIEADDDSAKPLFDNDEEEIPLSLSSKTITDDEDEVIEEINDDELDAEYDEYELESSELSENTDEASEPENTAEPISSQLPESDFDKDLNEFMMEELDLDSEEVPAELSIDDSSPDLDQAIQEQEEEGELVELDENQPAKDPFANYSDLDDDEQDKAIKELQDEMEATINKLSQQIEQPDEIPNSIKDLSEIHIGGETNIEDEYASSKEFFLEDHTEQPPSSDESDENVETPLSELSDSEILAAMEPELDETITEHKFEEEIPEISAENFLFESGTASSDIDYETKDESDSFSFKPDPIKPPSTSDLEQPTSYLGNDDSFSTTEKSDSLIDRLKFLQTRFENRYQPMDQVVSPKPRENTNPDFPTESFAETRQFTEKSKSAIPDSKEYMDLLESFIFMKDQKKHK